MTVLTPITPGVRVSFEVSDEPDPVTGTVTRVYTDAIGSEVAEISRPDGSTFLQCTRFLTAAPRRDMTDVTRYPRLKTLFGDGESAQRVLSDWFEQGCAVDSKLVEGSWQHTFIAPKGVEL